MTCNLRSQGHTLVSELITQEQIPVGSSNRVDRLMMWLAMNGQWPRSKG